MINTKIVAGLEKSLGVMVALMGLSLAYISTVGIVRALVVGIVLLLAASILVKKGRTQVDEREIYLRYVSNALSFLCSFAVILAIGFYQYLHDGAIAKPITLLMVIAGVSQPVFGLSLRRVA